MKLQLIDHQQHFEEQMFLILNSRTFARAPRAKKLLEYCVQRTAQGAERITEDEIGTKGFGLDARNFNPQQSGTVRKAKRSLNRHLNTFYAKEGAATPIRLVMPEKLYSIWFDRDWLPVSPEAVSQDASDRYEITLEAFRNFLQEMCDSEEISHSERNKRVAAWKDFNYPDLVLLEGDEFDSFFATVNAMTVADMRSLTKYLGIHPIMMDPLRSKPERGKHLRLRFQSTDDFMRVGQVNEKSYGRAVRYHVPSRRLEKTDASFVYLELDPGGSTDAHHHQGDELMFVLTGSIEVRLADSGIRIPLKEGDVAYYYADQTHSASHVNGKPARVLVIRFYQIAQTASRQRVRRELKSVFGQGQPSGKPGTAAIGFVLQTLARHGAIGSSESHLSATLPGEVQDRLGLARLLRRLPNPSEGAARHFLGKLPAVIEEARPSFEEWLNQLECNQAVLPKANLSDLHDLYRHTLPILFQEFLFPGVYGSMAFRYQDPEDEVDLEVVAPGLLPDSVSYSIPRRTLCCSDVSISRLKLAPGKGSGWNEHPGCELLVAIEGEGTISLRTAEGVHAVSVDKMGLVHYRSDLPHRVDNASKAEAVFLVVRFFAEAGTGF